MKRFLIAILLGSCTVCPSSKAQNATLGGFGHPGSSLRPTIHVLEVPIGGYTPFLGLGLTDEFKNENHADNFFTADLSFNPAGSWLGTGGPHFEVALLDTGASVSLITSQAAAAFNLAGHGFDGTEVLPIGGATGVLEAIVTDPLGVYVTGLANRSAANGSLGLETSTMVGLTSMSIAEAPPEWTLPSVIGIPVASQFTTFIRADEPQIFRHDGKTVRTPQVDLMPLGSGSQGLTMRAPLTLKNSAGFLTQPLYIFNILNILNELPLTENPSAPTILGQADAGLFLTVDVTNDGNSQDNQLFLFDTGASVSAVSQVMAAELGFDPVLDEPDFEVQVEGSGGTIESVPGFYAEELKIATVGGGFTLQNVPLVVLDITDPSNIGNVLPGLIGTNLFSDRNVVIEPVPSAGGGGVGPSLYISAPVTVDRQWMATTESASWHEGASWGQVEGPGPLWAATVRSQAAANQTAVVSEDSQIHRLLIAGGDDLERMDVVIEEDATLWVFGGVTVEENGGVQFDGGTLDAQFVDLRDGAILHGSGTVRTEFENRQGIVSPGALVSPGNIAGEIRIEGVFANRDQGTLAVNIAGTTPVEEYDVLTVNGNAFLGGTLQVWLGDFSFSFSPDVGDQFEIVTTLGEGEVFGAFDELLLPSGYDWNIDYGINSVVLEVLEILALAGDFSGNGLVEQADLDLVLGNWGGDGSTFPVGELVDRPTGIIDQEELDRVLANWGRSAGWTPFLEGATGVPEPSTILLVLFIFVTALGRRLCIRRR